MKGRLFITTMALITLICFSACKKKDYSLDSIKGKIYITFDVSGGEFTKAVYSGEDALSDSKDKTINTLDILVFNGEASAGDNIPLDMVTRMTQAQISNASSVSITTTSGNKTIYAIANSHNTVWTSVKTLGDLKLMQADLLQEGLEDFIMVGNAEGNIAMNTPVNISLSRLISRIELESIAVSFSNTHNSGKTLSNVKAYLINVNRYRKMADGGAVTGGAILNNGRYVATDCAGAGIEGMMYDGNIGTIPDGGSINVPHVFHCFENTISSETATDKFTRLVIEGTIGNTPYYYPISINREDFGYVPNSTKGVARNCWYKMNVTILRDGTTDPDVILDKGSVAVTITPCDWTIVNNGNIVF